MAVSNSSQATSRVGVPHSSCPVPHTRVRYRSWVFPPFATGTPDRVHPRHLSPPDPHSTSSQHKLSLFGTARERTGRHHVSEDLRPPVTSDGLPQRTLCLVNTSSLPEPMCLVSVAYRRGRTHESEGKRQSYDRREETTGCRGEGRSLLIRCLIKDY